MVEAQRVRIPADQRAVPDGRGPELTREHVERVALVAVADIADEPRVVLRLVPVPSAEQAEVRLRLARGGAEAALVVVPDKRFSRTERPKANRSRMDSVVNNVQA